MIKFNQPRYIVPLIILPFVYIFFYLFQYTMEDQETPEMALRETVSINPGLPNPFLDEDDLKDKFDAFQEAHKNKRDFSAMQEIDRRNESQEQDTKDSISPTPVQIPESQATIIPSNSINLPLKVYTAPDPIEAPKETGYDQEMQLFRAQMDYMDSIFRGDGERSGNVSPSVNLRRPMESPTVNLRRPMEKESDVPVQRMQKKSELKTGHFNTIMNNKNDVLIKAIIDEDLKVAKDSRIRIRLLEEVVVGEHRIPKGHYLYGMVAAFKPQRIEIHISSILLQGQITEISMDIYDLDGMKGLYVPQSQFRELAKDMGSGMAGNQQLNVDAPPDNQMQLMYGMAKEAFNTTTQAASKAIKKNKAKLKYSTMVYLVNSQKQQKSNLQTL